MNRPVMRYPLQAEMTPPTSEGADGGGDAPKTLLEGTEDAHADTDEGAEPTPNKSAADGDGNGNAPKKGGSLLDDDEEPTHEKKEDEGAADEGANKVPTEEEIDAWCKSVPELDLGDGVKWDNAVLKAMAPSLMGLKKEESGRVIKAYAEYTKAQAKAQAEAADGFNNGLIKQCQERFGEDLPKVAQLAKSGGREVFGDKIWNEMKKIAAFANNPDILEKLAAVGQRVATDRGKVIPKGSEGSDAPKGDILHRMYGNIGA